MNNGWEKETRIACISGEVTLISAADGTFSPWAVWLQEPPQGILKMRGGSTLLHLRFRARFRVRFRARFRARFFFGFVV